MQVLLYYFGTEAFCNKLKIEYETDDGYKTYEYEPTERDFYLKAPPITYTGIKIFFYSTNIPYRFLKIYKILFGLKKNFRGTDLMSASIDNEINILSSELASNKLSIDVLDQENVFNIVNKQGLAPALQENQKMKVYKIDGSSQKLLGNFYLTEWSNNSVDTASFEAQDLIGVLENYTFLGGMYRDYNAGKLIKEILAAAEVTDYEIDKELADMTVYGYVPICTCKEALQKVLFVIGGVCTTSEIESLKIFKTQNTVVNNVIDSDTKILNNTKVELNENVTGVEVTYYWYVNPTDYEAEEEIAQAESLKDEEITIYFDEPIVESSISCRFCTLLEAHCNYARFRVYAEEAGKVYGHKYRKETYKKTITRDRKDNVKANILTVQDVELINSKDVDRIANRILDYYQTYKTEVKVLAKDEIVGNLASVNTFNNSKLIGNITSISTDLVGGYISQIKIDNAILKEGTNVGYRCGQEDFYCGSTPFEEEMV